MQSKTGIHINFMSVEKNILLEGEEKNSIRTSCLLSTLFSQFQILKIKKKMSALILTNYYSLNRSSSKNVLVGIKWIREFQFECLDYFNVFVKLFGNNLSSELSFTKSSWHSFTQSFDTIDEFFKHFAKRGSFDQNYIGDGFLIKFTFSHGAKAIEIQLLDGSEELNLSVNIDEQMIKKFKPSICLHSVTFDGLKTICKIVNEKLEYLENLIPTISFFAGILAGEISKKIIGSTSLKMDLNWSSTIWKMDKLLFSTEELETFLNKARANNLYVLNLNECKLLLTELLFVKPYFITERCETLNK